MTELLAQGGEGGEGGAELSPGEQANEDFQDKLSGAELLSALQAGGYVIYFRHAQTEKDYADRVTADVNNCATQRVLSESGWQQAETIGKAFEENSIPLGEVISSKYCRAWKTADMGVWNLSLICCLKNGRSWWTIKAIAKRKMEVWYNYIKRTCRKPLSLALSD